MNNIFHIYANGDWLVERPYATGSDFGPGHYGEKPFDMTADKILPFYARQGFEIRDARATQEVPELL